MRCHGHDRREGLRSIRSGMGVDVRNRLDTKKREGRRNVISGMGIGVGNASTRCKGVRGFRSALLRCELAQDAARGFRIGKWCSGVVLMTREWHRQVGIG